MSRDLKDITNRLKKESDARKAAVRLEQKKQARVERENQARMQKAAATALKIAAVLDKAEKARIAQLQKQHAENAVVDEEQAVSPTALPETLSDDQSSDETEQRDILSKVVLLGDQGVGKTSFVKRVLHNIFSVQAKSTIGVNWETLEREADNNTIVRLHLWDIAPIAPDSSYWKSYFPGTKIIILMWDSTRPATFENIPRYLQLLEQFNLLDRPIVFLRGKCDFPLSADKKAEQDEQIKQWMNSFAKKPDYRIADVSPLNTQGIEEVKQLLTQKAVEVDDKLNAQHAEAEALPQTKGNKSDKVKADLNAPYQSSPFKHTRRVRRARLSDVREREDPRWLWLNYMSIKDKKSTTCIWLSNLLPEQAMESRLSDAELDVLRLLQILDSLETSVWNKLSLFERTKQKNINVQTQLYDAAKRISDANKPVAGNNNNNNNNVGQVVQIDFQGNLKNLPKEAAAIIQKYVKLDLVALPQHDVRLDH